MTTNMFGDILSDQASELSGSLGLPSASINAGDRHALAQALQHGSAPELAGKDVANPASLMVLAAMLLAGWANVAIRKIRAGGRDDRKALDARLPATRTRDLGGTLGTKAFTDAVIARLRAAS